MKETSTIYSVDTELIYATLKLSFPSNTKYSVLILCARASQTFCSVTPFNNRCFYAAPLMDRLDQLYSTRGPHAAQFRFSLG